MPKVDLTQLELYAEEIERLEEELQRWLKDLKRCLSHLESVQIESLELKVKEVWWKAVQIEELRMEIQELRMEIQELRQMIEENPSKIPQVKKRKFCPACGAELEEGTVFCMHCGRKVSSKDAISETDSAMGDTTSSRREVLCPRCGSKINAHLNFCPRCGEPMHFPAQDDRWETPPPPPPVYSAGSYSGSAASQPSHSYGSPFGSTAPQPSHSYGSPYGSTGSQPSYSAGSASARKPLAGKKRGIGGLFGKISGAFSRDKSEDSTSSSESSWDQPVPWEQPEETVAAIPETPAPAISRVEFSALAPKTLIKGDYSILHLMMYEKDFRQEVDRIIEEAQGQIQETRSGSMRVTDNAKVTVRLSSPDAEIMDPEDTRTWTGEYLDYTFAVSIPEDFSKHQVLFKAEVYINDLIASKLNFVVKCSSAREQKIAVAQQDILTAFVSYASQDRSRVAAIIQGMQKARPDMDIFFDVESLRSGTSWEDAIRKEIELRDIFFLCWSLAAKDSAWVQREWKYALAQKGLECIEPVPLDSPKVCPPPEELKQKHFNDRMLFVIQAEQ